MESQIMEEYKKILAGEMPYVETHLEMNDSDVAFEVEESVFFLHKADGPLPVRFSEVKKAWLFLVCKGKSVEKEIIWSYEGGQKAVCRCALPSLSGQIPFVSRWNWNVYLTLETGQGYQIFRLKENGENKKPIKKGKNLYFNRQNQYYTPHEEFTLAGTDMISMLYITSKSNYALLVLEREKRYMTQFVLLCRKMKINQKGLSLLVRSDYPERHWKGFCLSYRSDKNKPRERYFFPLKKKKMGRDGKLYLHAFFDLEKIDFRPLIWYITAVFEEDGKEYRVNLKIGIQRFNLLFCGFFSNHCYVDEQEQVLFPYRTQSGSIALKVRERTEKDSIKVRLRERLAIHVYPVCKRILERRNIYLVYEKYCEMAQDNGYYFFRYCMENNAEQELGSQIYYIIDIKSPDYQKLRQYGEHVVPFLSFRYFLYIMAAKLLISSDNKLHAFTWNPMPSLIPEVIARKNHVFLQHGVTALKIVRNVFDRNGKFATDLFVVTSEKEKQIILKNYHYKEDEIAVTGFARWDVLHDRSGDRKEILVMPTWRKGLDNVSDEEFCESDYFRAYSELLNSKRLQKILSENNVTICFYIHPKLRQYFSHFSSDLENVLLISFSEMPLNELLMRCKLLITDYSSVSWDVFYQSKPVLFYQFDIDKYNETNGSFVDMERDLFGDRALELDTLLDLVEEYISRDFALKDFYRAMLADSFAFIDDENSKRICEAINAKEWVVKTERRYV